MVVIRKHPKLRRRNHEDRLLAYATAIDILGNGQRLAPEQRDAILRMLKAEYARIQKQQVTRFALVNKLTDYLRRHKDAFDYQLVAPTARIEEMLAIIEDEGGVG
jgi:hypothetical protein